MRILVTSDLHMEVTGHHTIHRLVAGMEREEPDLVVIAGDLGNPLHMYEQCLACFSTLPCTVAVLPGNHDLWASNGQTSRQLYEKMLPEATRQSGMHWLEDVPLVLENGIAVAGGIGWYDYSARDPQLDQSDDDIAECKPRYAMDASKIDWAWTDQEFAATCRHRLQRQLLRLEEDEEVNQVLVVTHVPIFESQIERRPEDQDWSKGTPYFGHLTLGESLRGFPKLRYVVSGHTHVGLNGVVNRPGQVPIGSAVVGSDYGRPRWVTVEM